MNEELEKLEKAKLVLEKIAAGINPLTNEVIEKESFLHEPKIIRCFYYIAELLDKVIKNGLDTKVNKAARFVITPEQKCQIKLPQGLIGVNEFSRCVNQVLDPVLSRRLTGVELNKRLKKLGILSETSLEGEKTRTIVNDRSKEFGFESEARVYRDVEYTMVVMNDHGKRYLLDNLESIMETAV